MKIIAGKIRNMREEYLWQGKQRDTDEIRETYDLGSLRSNISFLPRNETQQSHKHLIVIEAIHVLAGQIEVFCDGKWILLNEREVAVFSLDEVHNIRTGSQVKEITYPRTTNNIAAVTIVYKWIPPLFEIHSVEMNFIIQNDWFSDQFDQNI